MEDFFGSRDAQPFPLRKVLGILGPFRFGLNDEIWKKCKKAEKYQHQEIIGLLSSAELDKKVKAMQNAQRYIELRIEDIESSMNVKTAQIKHITSWFVHPSKMLLRAKFDDEECNENNNDIDFNGKDFISNAK